MKLRYKLHWNNGLLTGSKFKWVIYDWKYKCPVAYAETRVKGRKICNFYNLL